MSGAVCINGTIYYRGKTIYYRGRATDYGYASVYKLMSFDVRSEQLCHVDAPETLMDHQSFLIDYQGKLGFVCCDKGVEIWVRGDGDQKIQGWSKIFFYDMEGFEKRYISGVTRDGEIVFVDFGYGPDVPLRVLCYDPMQNSVRDVDLGGTWPGRRKTTIISGFFQCFVENTMGLY
ncbi:unnamed protein product [Microthlaspi erraticum]|uniref:F-box associated beta-propeller type 3 domain-containing protein n=1 Tax=Microthlaspi erraticum TaxID=1685480 RepID=A0A6D2KUB8_9BRAS|nr:unnamed protein product [Microthlaspi erraticum]